MRRDDQRLVALAGDLGSFENVRCAVELLNCQESVKIRRLQLDYLRNETKTEQMRHALNTLSHDLQYQYKCECKNIDKKSRDLIRKLEEDAEQQRQQILDDIEKAHMRLQDATERIEASQEILQREIPRMPVSNSQQISEQVLKNRIKGLKETIDNLASKRPRWQKIEEELEKIRRKSNRKSPTRKENPKFVMNIRRLATD